MSPVITEHHVRGAAATGSLVVPRGAIVTPAARDLAARLGVALTGDQAARPRAPRPAPRATSTVALGADHGGFRLKEVLKPVVEHLGFRLEDVGCHSTDAVDYPVFAARVADLVADGVAAFGIAIDGAGIGSAMVANKAAGVRAALCYDLTTARNAREHNDANVLTLGGTLIGDRLAGEIVTAFLTTPFGGGRHARRVAMIDALDGERGKGRGE
jgi:ribose 5-phosphate isomerase B